MSLEVTPDVEEASGNRIRFIFLSVALALGLFVALSRRSYMNPDGISYLDMGDAFWRQDWRAAINGYWSPLYGLLLGLVLNFFHVGPRLEFLAVHLVNFAIYAVSLLSFDFFLRTLIGYHNANVRRHGNTFATLPKWAWYGLGYTLFIWSSLDVMSIFSVTPDMLNSAMVYLASGMVIRIRTGLVGLRPFGLLGIILGLGYLTRASMFPLALVFLGVALTLTGGFRRSLPGVIVGSVLFLMVSGPLIAGLTLKEGHPTIGDGGKLAYAFVVNGVPLVHWQGGPPGCGSPHHPPRRVFEVPTVYEFGTPIVATYPLWFDPAYWNDGIIPCFHLRQWLSMLMINAKRIYAIGFQQVSALAVAVIALSYWERSRPRHPLVEGLFDNLHLLIIACAGLAMYAWVLVEPRYIAAFVTLLWMGIFSAVRFGKAPESMKIVRAVMVAVVTVMLIIIGVNTSNEVLRAIGFSPPDAHWEVAEGLTRVGIRPGDKVAVFGKSFGAYWARLARARIVAEIPTESTDAFWTAAPEVKAEVIAALFRTGAKAIIAEGIPSTNDQIGWKRIGNTEFFAYAKQP